MKIDDDDLFQFYTPELAKVVLALLDAKDVSELSGELETFRDQPEDFYEEPWSLPEGSQLILSFGDDVKTQNFHYGHVGLYERRGLRFVATLNASPFLFYYKKVTNANNTSVAV